MVLARTQRSQRSGDPGALGAAHLASCGPIGTEGDRLEAPRRFLMLRAPCAPSVIGRPVRRTPPSFHYPLPQAAARGMFAIWTGGH